jgi:putative PIN family toxin of toxin-antitoxin system
MTLDTNVLVSAFIAKHGHSANLLELVMTLENVELVLSTPILDEFENVLNRNEVKSRFEYTEHDIRKISIALKASARIVSLNSNFRVVKEDPKDDMVLNTSYDGHADYIVSGDNHLLKLGSFKGIKIVNPKRMMSILSKKFPEFVFHI